MREVRHFFAPMTSFAVASYTSELDALLNETAALQDPVPLSRQIQRKLYFS